jgi:hypothetical protein
LFISIRIAASCAHPLQDNAGPRGALTWRLAMFIVDDDPVFADSRHADPARSEGSKSKNVRARCQFEIEKFLT